MRFFRTTWLVLLASSSFGCSDEAPAPAEPGSTGGQSSSGSSGGGGAGGGLAPGPEFDRFCREADWAESLEPATVGELHGDYLGVLANAPIVAGTMEGQKFVPDHPFHVTRIRAAFAGAPGKVRLRLTTTYGRSFPWPWPDTADLSQDLMPPVEVEVSEPDPEVFVEIDVADAGIFLLPTQHYMLVYEHLTEEPLLAVEGVPAAERVAERDYSRAGIFFPDTLDGGGIGGTAEVPSVNYRVELQGERFCAWQDDERWFSAGEQPFSSLASQSVTVADVDGDGHDDVIVYPGDVGAAAFFGDGSGAFSAASWDVFADAPETNMLVFADVDGDGDRDAFASVFALVDGDGDGYDILGEGDCNDADASVHPGATEVVNGRDDDCDGTADDGMDGSDADGDGATIAGGDCDDTLAAIHPGAAEILDGLDNECDGAVDEEQHNRVLLNDGSGHFSTLGDSGVESLDPTASAGFADADGDGALDVYLGNWLVRHPGNNPGSEAVQDRFLAGNGDGTFVEATAAAGMILPQPLPALDVLWHDFDDDGDADLLVGNYLLMPNQLWQNQGDGSFVDVAPILGVAIDDIPSPNAQFPGGHTFGADFGDVDGDGFGDFYLCNLSHPRFAPWSDPSQLLVSQGLPSLAFEDRREERGLHYDEGDSGVQLADFDNDMDLDLAVASLYESHFSRLYRNDGAGGFTDVTYETGTAVRDAITVTWSDVDEDGDLDLLLSDRGGEPSVHLFENRVGQDRAWAMFELVGAGKNRDAVGARVHLVAGDVEQFRDVRAGANRGANQASHWVHFGLDDATVIHALVVRWPDGTLESFSGAEPRGRYELVQGTGSVARR